MFLSADVITAPSFKWLSVLRDGLLRSSVQAAICPRRLLGLCAAILICTHCTDSFSAYCSEYDAQSSSSRQPYLQQRFSANTNIDKTRLIILPRVSHANHPSNEICILSSGSFMHVSAFNHLELSVFVARMHIN